MAVSEGELGVEEGHVKLLGLVPSREPKLVPVGEYEIKSGAFENRVQA